MRIGTYLEKVVGWSSIFEQAANYDGTSGMVFIGAPQTYAKPKISAKDADYVRQFGPKAGLKDLVIHASFIGNLCSSDISTRIKTINMIVAELRNADLVGASKVCIHPGAAVGASVTTALQRLKDSLAEILVLSTGVRAKLLVETMAGKGTEIFNQMEHWLLLMNYFRSESNRIGLCLDTCHISDAGYSMNSAEEIETIVTLMRKVGLQQRVDCIHLNGSINPCGSRKDRHAQLIDQGSYFTMEHAKILLAQPGWNEDLSGIIECWSSAQARAIMCNELTAMFE